MTNAGCERSIWVAFALVASAGLGAVVPQGSRTGADTLTNTDHKYIEVKVGELPDESRISGNPLVDENGWHYGVAVLTPGGKSLWLDGKYGPEFQDFVDAHVSDVGLQYDYRFSPDGQQLAYGARLGGKCLMVRDGKPDQAGDDVNRPTFSPDGRHLAYVMERDGQSRVVLDGVPGPACDIVCGQIYFSPDSRRIAYIVSHGKETCLVVDQKELPDWPGPWNPVFSPDSKHIAYTSIKGFAVLDGRKGPEFPGNMCWGPVFSPDSSHFAYTLGKRTQEEWRERAFVDWQSLPLPNHGTGVWHTVFSPDLKRWACIAKMGDKERVVVDGKESPLLEGAYGLTFSSDNRRFAYMAETITGWVMVVDGKQEAEIDLGPSHPYFSPNGQRLAYIAGRGPLWSMMVDGKPGPKFKGTRGHVGMLSYEQELSALTAPKFSPDSSHVAYAALLGDKWGVLFDNKPLAAKYEKIIFGGPSFRADGTLEFLGIRQGVLYRVSTKQITSSRPLTPHG